MPPVSGSIASAPARPGWQRELRARLATLQWLKIPGVTAFVWLFFIGYFALLRNPAFPVTVMPMTALDEWVGFSPGWLGAYLSLWLYVGVPPGLMLRFRELVVYGLWTSALGVAGLACFYFWPTAVPAHPIDVAAYPAFAVLQGVDAPGNACPSMHVAASVFTALWLRRYLHHIGAPAWLHAVNWGWAAAIVYSTLAVKQHVLLDAIGGTALGVAFAALSLALTPAPQTAEKT